jgi:GT2 family glycosyltransferase
MNNIPKIFTVIPNWNGAEYLKDCIDSLLKQSVKCEVVVVDNGSTDKSDEVLSSYGDKIIALKQDKNLGFAGGVNVGIRYALKHNADYIALFNNDAVADREWAKQLLNTIEPDKSIGITTCNLMQIDKIHIDSTGDFYCRSGIPFPRGRNEVQKGQYDKHTEVFGASGGASLYRAEVFKDIGLFDEKFFAYFEDVDLSFRARLRGWRIVYSPKALVYHHVSATSSKLGYFAIFQSAKNFWLVMVKNLPAKLILKYSPFIIYRYFRMMAGRLVRGGMLTYIKGSLAFIKLLPYALKERKKIQKSRKITVTELDKLIWHGKPGKFTT